MDLRNCRRCGRPYLYTGLPLCPNCQAEDEKFFDAVKDYLFTHPTASLGQIIHDTGVPYEVIVRFLREGRLILRGQDPALPCQRCGVPIPTGRYCEDCLSTLERELQRGAKREGVGSPRGTATGGRGSVRMYTYQPADDLKRGERETDKK